MDDGLVDAVLDVGRLVGRTPETLGVGLVLGKEQGGRAGAGERVAAERLMVRGEGDKAGARSGRNRRPPVILAPAPRVSKPERRQQVERRGLRAAIGRADLD